MAHTASKGDNMVHEVLSRYLTARRAIAEYRLAAELAYAIARRHPSLTGASGR